MAMQSGRWTSQEKVLLEQLVNRYRTNWNEIAKHFPTRSARQIREHYQNHQNPQSRCSTNAVNPTNTCLYELTFLSVDRRRITPEESKQILTFYELFGPQWTLIASCVSERFTGVMIRNHWNNHQRKLRRNIRSAEHPFTTGNLSFTFLCLAPLKRTNDVLI
ncbi:8459_t:CDS:2 [Acaulospora morrowiae]|uniref:8459_t:CDS:1 n=1 Tax=Acaulospora morrowiae TaxID=94023 RepID=A0A9N8ZFE1_9GLOM|nr:8459_t:CDS:2 [Acaulospora morrowiae]